MAMVRLLIRIVTFPAQAFVIIVGLICLVIMAVCVEIYEGLCEEK